MHPHDPTSVDKSLHVRDPQDLEPRAPGTNAFGATKRGEFTICGRSDDVSR
jgi:hypothetical protein